MGLFEMKPGQGKHEHRQPDGSRRIMLPGDRVECEPEELGGALNKFKRLDPELPPAQPRVGLKIIHRGGGWFDVVNQTTGSKLNDEALRKADAYGLVMDVTGVDASALIGLDDDGDGSKAAGTDDGVQMIIMGPHGVAGA